MNHMTIKGQYYRQYVRQQRAAANLIKEKVKNYHDSLQIITEGYNSLLNGKWKYMMSLKQNYEGSSSYFMLPLMEESYTPVGAPKLALQAESEILDKGGISYHSLPVYNTFSRKSHWVDVYNQGSGDLSWTAKPSDDWIIVSQKLGKLRQRTESGYLLIGRKFRLERVLKVLWSLVLMIKKNVYWFLFLIRRLLCVMRCKEYIWKRMGMSLFRLQGFIVSLRVMT